MKLMHIALAGLMLGLTAGPGMAQKGQTLVEGETVIAANVKTGAQFLAIVRGHGFRRLLPPYERVG